MELESEVRCINAFRMEKHVLRSLCDKLQQYHGLRPSRNMCVLEKEGILLHTLAIGASNRATCEISEIGGHY